LAASNWQGIFRGAHSLKSNSATVGALALAEHCRRLEIAGREQDMDSCRELFSEVMAACAVVRPDIETLMG